jgi:hypothetical protein
MDVASIGIPKLIKRERLFTGKTDIDIGAVQIAGQCLERTIVYRKNGYSNTCNDREV